MAMGEFNCKNDDYEQSSENGNGIGKSTYHEFCLHYTCLCMFASNKWQKSRKEGSLFEKRRNPRENSVYIYFGFINFRMETSWIFSVIWLG